MSVEAPTNPESTGESAMWRGIDFSGIILVLGAGTGRLLSLLNEQVARADGTLALVGFDANDSAPFEELCRRGPLAAIRGRSRQLPVLSETVDLLVVNGVLRRVPEGRLGLILEEFWRVLVPGGRLRVSDIIDPSETDYNLAWAMRNEIVRKLSRALERPAALSVSLRDAAVAIRATGFEDAAISILAGYLLTDAWLGETVSAVRAMASRVANRTLRDDILDNDLESLVEFYHRGGQRAAERFALKASKPGDLALAMEASFTEDDLVGPE